MSNYPQRIVCLTEEAVEFLYAIGEEHRIVGVSAYVKRPQEATKLPKVTAFVSGHIKKICDLKPDLVIGFSDIQKDLARDLIAEGLNVFIANHRSITEILDYLEMLGRLVNKQEETEFYLDTLKIKLYEAELFAKSLVKKPRVYLEEWDDPMITGIKWFSQIVELCGAENVFSKASQSSLAQDRTLVSEQVINANPDIIFACWCGKPVIIDSIRSREGWSDIAAVKNNQVIELEPEIFLQPGPAPIISGIDIIIKHLKDWAEGNDLPDES